LGNSSPLLKEGLGFVELLEEIDCPVRRGKPGES
jgi:hypothetical protein